MTLLGNEIVGFLESPKNGEKFTGNYMDVGGWVFSKNNTDLSINIYLDDKKVGETKGGLTRPDVAKSYPDAKNASKSGFSFRLNLHDVEDGTHEIKIIIKYNYIEKLLLTANFDLYNRSEKTLRMLEKNNISLSNLDTIDILDALYLKICDPTASEYCPPPHVRKIIQGNVSLWSYTSAGTEYATFLKLLCGLEAHHKILEVGCGCGRIASLLKYYMKKPGCFYGFDVIPELIYHAKKLFDPSLFQFTCINIYSKMYNPDPSAVKAEDLKFPYEAKFFDIVYLVSVFTHILPPSIKNYVKEISRVTKINGKCMISIFLLQNNPIYLKGNWKENVSLDRLGTVNENPDSRYFKIGNATNPEDWVIYDLDYLLNIFKDNGFELLMDPFWGNWSGYPNWLTHQDILVFEKKL